MDSAICEVTLPDGSIRVSDGIWERHLRLDAIEKYGYLRVDVTRFVLRDGSGGTDPYLDAEGIPLSQPKYDHFYVVANAAELAGGTVRWMGIPVTRAVDGEPVVLTKLALAQELYGAVNESEGFYQSIAQLYARIEAQSPARPGTSPEERDAAAARELGITPRLLARALAYAPLPDAPGSPDEDEWEEAWGE